MRNLLSKIKNYINFNSKLVRLYLFIFYILNIAYFCLEISKNKLYKLFNANPDQQKFYYEKISNISGLNNSIVSLILIISLLYLVSNLIKYKNEKAKGVNEYLIITIVSMLSMRIVGGILFAISSTYYLLEPNIAATLIPLVVLIFTLIKRGYKLLLSRGNHQIS